MKRLGFNELALVLAVSFSGFFAVALAQESQPQEIPPSQAQPPTTESHENTDALPQDQTVATTDGTADAERRESTITVSRAPRANLNFDGDAARVREGFFRIKEAFVDMPVKPNVTGRLRKNTTTFGLFQENALPAGTPVFLTRYQIDGERAIETAEDFWCAPLLKGERAVPDHEKAVALTPYVGVVCAPVTPKRGVPGTRQHFASNSPPFLLRPQVVLRVPPGAPRDGEICTGCSNNRAIQFRNRMVPWDVSIEAVEFAVDTRAQIYATAIGDSQVSLRIDYQEGRGNLQLGSFVLPVRDGEALFELPIGRYQIIVADDKSGITVKRLSGVENSNVSIGINDLLKY